MIPAARAGLDGSTGTAAEQTSRGRGVLQIAVTTENAEAGMRSGQGGSYIFTEQCVTFDCLWPEGVWR